MFELIKIAKKIHVSFFTEFTYHNKQFMISVMMNNLVGYFCCFAQLTIIVNIAWNKYLWESFICINDILLNLKNSVKFYTFSRKHSGVRDEIIPTKTRYPLYERKLYCVFRLLRPFYLICPKTARAHVHLRRRPQLRNLYGTVH